MQEPLQSGRSGADETNMRAEAAGMSGMRTNAAADLLGVSASTLRTWERRFGFPRPRRTPGGHRQYDRAEIESLRHALLETHRISAAIELARRRGTAPSSSSRLVDALEHLDEAAADRVLEESIAVRSLERTIEELMLPALEAIGARPGYEAEHEVALRWATGWLYSARRIAPPASRAEGLLLFESRSGAIDAESLHVQALELAFRRAGFRVLVLSADLPRERIARAVRALEPVLALVLCGSGATLDAVGRLVHTARQSAAGAPVFEYRAAMPVAGGHTVRSIGDRPSEAVDALRAMTEGVEEAVEPVTPIVARPRDAAG
jgi:MerR family transcriptional regulator, light-induced transcriptional regulator